MGICDLYFVYPNIKHLPLCNNCFLFWSLKWRVPSTWRLPLLNSPAIPPHQAQPPMLGPFGREALAPHRNTKEGFWQINWGASRCFHPISCPRGAVGEHSSHGCNVSSHRGPSSVHKTVAWNSRAYQFSEITSSKCNGSQMTVSDMLGIFRKGTENKRESGRLKPIALI